MNGDIRGHGISEVSCGALVMDPTLSPIYQKIVKACFGSGRILATEDSTDVSNFEHLHIATTTSTMTIGRHADINRNQYP